MKAIIQWFVDLFNKIFGRDTGPVIPPRQNPITPPAASWQVTTRTFPSVFQGWNPADNLPGEDVWTTVARHDLLIHVPEYFRMRWKGVEGPVMCSPSLSGEIDPETIPAALEIRTILREKNPNMVILVQIGYYEASDATCQLPLNHSWWMRDAAGNRIMNWAEGGAYRLNLKDPTYIAHVCKHAKSAMDTGVFDGIMLDVWAQDDADHLNIIKKLRAAVGDAPLIIANANASKFPVTAPYLNGMYMECGTITTEAHTDIVIDAIHFNEAVCRSPVINCLEYSYQNSRNDLSLMRSVTTIGLVFSNGYVLFADPNRLPVPDHLHDWYPFWEKGLGRPKAEFVRRQDGAYQRGFDHGTVVYNPIKGGRITVAFPTPHTSRATGITGLTHQLSPADGDIYLN